MSNYDLDLYNKKYKKEESIGSLLWGATKIVSKFTWDSTKFIAKNTPTALGAAWEVKKEISNGIAQGIHEIQQENKRINLENEIKALCSTPKLEYKNIK